MGDPLLDAVLANPADDAPRLVWADREGGERGELVVLQCLLERRELPRPERVRLKAREKVLLKQAEAWAQLPLRGRPTFVRGFVEELAAGLDDVAAHLQALLERAPLLRSLRLHDVGASIGAFAGPTEDEAWAARARVASGLFAQLPEGRITALAAAAEVSISGDWSDPAMTIGFGDEFAALVAAAPSLQALTELELSEGNVGRGALPFLAALPRLARLSMSHCLGGAGCVEALRALPGLRWFGAVNGDPKLHGPELAMLLAAPELRRLEGFELGLDGIDDEDLEALAGCPGLSGLTSLHLELSRASELGVVALGRSPHLAGLQTLQLTGVRRLELGALLRARFAPRLRRLIIQPPTFSPADLLRCLELPALELLSAQSIDPRTRAQLEAQIPEVY